MVVRSEFWGNEFALDTSRISRQDLLLNKLLKRRGNQAFRELLVTLLGTAPGATAQAQFMQIKASNDPDSFGGKVVIETVNDINRATTAADVTALTKILEGYTPTLKPSVDKSGNQAGGASGY